MPVLEQEPAAAAVVFGDHIEQARAFTDALAAFGEERGLIGPLEVPRLWTRHILNSAVVAPLLAGSVADIGSGAGLPGIVLAIARPDVSFTLIEPMERRVVWLNEQVEQLALANVTVTRARAEEVDLQRAFDIVTARAVSAFRTLLPLTAPLVRDGGQLLLLKGASVEKEIDAAEKALRKYRVSNISVEVLGAELLEEPTRVLKATVR